MSRSCGSGRSDAVTPEALQAVDELGSLADLRADELDRDCRIPQDLHTAAVEAGLFRLLVPVDLGGGGATPLEWFRCGVQLARHETSFGWVVTQGAVEMGYIAVGGDPAWAKHLLSDPTATVASSVAGMGALRESGPDLLFSGRWAFNTGAPSATWVGGLATVTGSDPPDVRLAYLPSDRAMILDDWDPSGLRGSGSNSTVVVEQAIDPAWVLRPFTKVGGERGPLRCLLGNGNWPIATSVAATLLGAARRALDEAAAFLAGTAAASVSSPTDSGAWIRQFMEYEARWHASCASIEHELAAMWHEADSLGALSTQQRVRLFAANALARRQTLRIIQAVCDMTGTLSISRRHPLSRVRRDAEALSTHRAVNGEAIEHAGRMWLGLSPPHRRI